jgi:tight adherence protein B
MNRRIGIVLSAALTALTCFAAAGTAAAAPAFRLTEAGGPAFPQRTYILTLSAGQRLDPAAVRVTENGHGVVDVSVTPAGAAGGVSSGTVLAIDASNSMRGAPIEGAMDAARAFAARRNVNQRLGVLTFNSSTHVAVSLTTSQAAIDRALVKQPQLGFKTNLYDAVAQAIVLDRAAGIGAGSVIVMSDGADIGSTVTLEQVIESAKIAHIRVFTVGLRSKTFRAGPLQQLATATGGSFSRADSPTDLQGIYEQLGLRLAQEYILTYHSIVKPGSRVTLDVSIEGVGSATAGYVTPATPGPNAVFHSSKSDRIWQSAFLMIAISLLVPGLIASFVVVPLLRRRDSTVRARVSDYVTMPDAKREGAALVSRVFTGTERSLERTRWWQRFKDALRFADIGIPPVQVVVGTLVVTLFAIWILWQISGVIAFLGLGVPLAVRAVIVARAARKRRSFADQLPDNLDVLASGLRAGHSLVGALSVVVADAAEPSRTEFQHVIADEQLGVPLDQALDKVVKRMRSRDLEQVALVASVQSETGGNAAEVLDRVTESIRERQELRRLVSSLTAQGRLARWIVSALPVGLLVGIQIINPGYLKPMFTHTSGIIMLTFGLVMIVCGSVVIGRIVNIKV